MARPCSSHVYQVTPTPACWATSSRRRPGVRRRPPSGSPRTPGERRSRRERRNEASSRRGSATGSSGAIPVGGLRSGTGAWWRRYQDPRLPLPASPTGRLRACGLRKVRLRPMSANQHVVETSGLTKRFGQRVAVQDVELHVPAGVAFGFLGPNGAGKTTLIRMLVGLTSASAGQMRLLGKPVPERRSEALKKVGAIVEEPRFHGHLTGRENLQCAAAARGHETYARIAPALERVGLSSRADDPVKGYSLGMRQRLGIARCLPSDPTLPILDEPMNGLDPAGILEMRGLIRAFVDEGRTVFLSSHLLEEVERTCDQVAIIDRGQVVTQGAIADITQGEQALLTIGVDDDDAARRALSGNEAVAAVVNGDEGTLRITLAGDGDRRAAAARINRTLVEAGVEVHLLEPSRVSLEDRFLEITSRLGDEQ